MLCATGLTACGDYPTPFKGRPGAEAERLAQPTAPLLVVIPPDAAAMPRDARTILADDLAKALQEHEVPAVSNHPIASAWQLVTKLEARGNTIVPVFAIVDNTGKNHGTAEGAPASADAWVVSSPDMMQRVAVDAAPKIIDLLVSIRITRDMANPNSMLNRAPRAMVAEVTGAPGDGNQALTRLIREHLKGYGVLVGTDKAGADFFVAGSVKVTPIPGKKDRVEIVWTVSLPNGDERGKVVQLNEIPGGTLNHYWGEVAVAVATEAASGLNDVINRQSGRTEAAEAAAKAAAAAAHR